ncbi:Protein FAR1-RELATED SEQUENCE 5 [Platanthera zijinensis]|uniref:Protein FAR1-RELATED SEQUENCE 5 n=1 Tax=Platanthera zijinensis TaxID=2320716 RepID=A0AAP0B4A6_9ASPA
MLCYLEECFDDFIFTSFAMTSESSNSKSMDVVVAETNTDSTEPSVKEPYVSLVFESVDEAYWFYNSYTLNVGFGIKKGSTSKSFSSGDVIARRFECNKSGLKTSKEGEGSSTRAHRLTRVNCKAKLDIRKNKDDKWVVTGFIKEHNHELDTPRKAKRHRSHNVLHKDKEIQIIHQPELMVDQFAE